MIGDVVPDHSKTPHLYHADVVKNEDGTFCIEKLCLIKPDSVNVGWMTNNNLSKNYITVVKSITAGDDITIYPSGVISVNYIKD
jgi:hypothetical protein